ncbi:MAG: thioredoxin [Clostridia bacterium]
MIIEELNSRNFSENVLESSIPVVVDFFATWCSPCKALAPVLVELAKEYDGKIKFFKLNIDEEEDLAREFGIMSIPTLALFKNGKVVNQSVGLKPIEVLRKFITI